MHLIVQELSREVAPRAECGGVCSSENAFQMGTVTAVPSSVALCVRYAVCKNHAALYCGVYINIHVFMDMLMLYSDVKTSDYLIYVA